MRIQKLLTQSNVIIAVAVLALIAVGVALYVSIAQSTADKEQTILVQRSRITTLLQQNGKLQSQQDGLTKEYTKLYGEAKSSGVQPTTISPSTLPAAGATGATGATGQSGKDGRGIAFALCTLSGWEVTYTDGSTVNAGTCIGQTGATGPSGANGTDGTDGAAGASGTDGTPGAQGARGVGVASIDCASTSDGSTAFQFTLTDGTVQDVPGTCTPTTSGGTQ